MRARGCGGTNTDNLERKLLRAGSSASAAPSQGEKIRTAASCRRILLIVPRLRDFGAVATVTGTEGTVPAVARSQARPAALPSCVTSQSRVRWAGRGGGRGQKGLVTTAGTELAKGVNLPAEHQLLQAALRASAGVWDTLATPGVKPPQHPHTNPGSQNNSYTQMLPKEIQREPPSHGSFPSSAVLSFHHAGISGKSQILFALVFTTRYLDLFTNFISVYNTVMKVRRGQCSRRGSPQLAVVSQGGEGTQSPSFSAGKGG